MDFKSFYDELIFDVDSKILQNYSGKQGDTKSRGIYVTVAQKGVVIEDLTGLSMAFYAEKPDETRLIINGALEGGKFRIDYTNQLYSVSGVVKAELVLRRKKKKKISNKSFGIRVYPSLVDGSIVSVNERGILDRAFELATDIVPRMELIDITFLEQAEIKENARITAENIREQGEADRDTNYELSEQNRNNLYEQAEADRGNLYSLAESNRNLRVVAIENRQIVTDPNGNRFFISLEVYDGKPRLKLEEVI